MRVVIHIGTNKTGTSAIQRYLGNNPHILRGEGLIYPITGRRTPDYPAHHAMAEELHEFPHRADYIVSQLEEEAANEQVDGVFLSSEVFHTINPLPFVQTLQEAGHQVEAVCVLRNHVDYFASWYRETVKSEISTFDFPNFAYLINKPYSPFLKHWLNAVGEGNLAVYRFDQHRYSYGAFTNSAFNMILSRHEDFPVENPSVTGNLLLFKRILNNFIIRETSELLIPEMEILASFEQRFLGSMFIAPDLCDMIDKAYASDAQAIQEYFEVDLFSLSDHRVGQLIPDFRYLHQDRDFVIQCSIENDLQFGPLVQKYIGRM